MCYFTWLCIYLGNEIIALHNLTKLLFREDPNICKSNGFYSRKKKKKKNEKGKNGKKEQIRQLVKEMGIVSMLATWFIRTDTHLHMQQGVHIIARVGMLPLT